MSFDLLMTEPLFLQEVKNAPDAHRDAVVEEIISFESRDLGPGTTIVFYFDSEA